MGGMPEENRYRVTEAVLTKTDGGSVWRLVFVPVASEEEADPIEVLVSPTKVDDMYFAVQYSHEEIMDLSREAPDA